MKNRYYRVGGLTFCIHPVNVDGAVVGMPDSYQPFRLQDQTDDLLFTLTLDQVFHFSEMGTKLGRFNEDNNPQEVYRKADGGYQFLLYSYDKVLSAEMETDQAFRYITLRLQGSPQQQLFGLNNAVMISYAFSSARCGTLLMHSSVTMLRSWGYMFLGKSGTGKSTHSALWLKYFQGTELLNDDNPVLRVNDKGRVTVYGSPWSGKTPCYKNKHARVGALVMLEQKPYNRIERQDVPHALSSLLISCSLMMWDGPTYHAIINTISRILQAVPVYHLENLPNRDAAELCRSVIER